MQRGVRDGRKREGGPRTPVKISRTQATKKTGQRIWQSRSGTCPGTAANESGRNRRRRQLSRRTAAETADMLITSSTMSDFRRIMPSAPGRVQSLRISCELEHPVGQKRLLHGLAWQLKARYRPGPGSLGSHSCRMDTSQASYPRIRCDWYGTLHQLFLTLSAPPPPPPISLSLSLSLPLLSSPRCGRFLLSQPVPKATRQAAPEPNGWTPDSSSRIRRE